jgi:hypothetical protein
MRARGRRRFKPRVKTAGQHFVCPSSKNRSDARAPFRGGDADMLSPHAKTKVDWRMVGKSRKETFNSIEDRRNRRQLGKMQQFRGAVAQN